MVQSIARAPRHGNGCPSAKARSSRSPIAYILFFSPLSPSSHSAIPDNTVDHGHVDPNGQVSDPPLSPKPFIFEPSSLWTKRWILTSPRSASIRVLITTVTTRAPTLSPPTMRGQLIIQTTCRFILRPTRCLCNPSIVSRRRRHPSANNSSRPIPKVLARNEGPMATMTTPTTPKWVRMVAPVAPGTGQTRKRQSCSTGSWAPTKTNISTLYEPRRIRVSETWVFFFFVNIPLLMLSQCALDAFGGRKTFLAVKGCYERNFVVFKQIYAFETFTAGMQQADVDSDSEVDRLREYERRIYAARKAGFHVGNLSSRILDHWHRMGWYATFHSR